MGRAYPNGMGHGPPPFPSPCAHSLPACPACRFPCNVLAGFEKDCGATYFDLSYLQVGSGSGSAGAERQAVSPGVRPRACRLTPAILAMHLLTCMHAPLPPLPRRMSTRTSLARWLPRTFMGRPACCRCQVRGAGWGHAKRFDRGRPVGRGRRPIMRSMQIWCASICMCVCADEEIVRKVHGNMATCEPAFRDAKVGRRQLQLPPRMRLLPCCAAASGALLPAAH